MRVALVHDHLAQHGGAERVLETLQSLYPQAPVYTLIYDAKALHGAFDHKDIRTSRLANFPFHRRLFRYLLPLMPAATEAYDLKGYDVVISSSSAFAKGVITHPGTLHLSYIHCPTRYLWSDMEEYVRDLKAAGIVKKILPYILHYLRSWDFLAAQRPDVLLANSGAVRERIKRYYKRDATVLYPPVDTHRFVISDNPKTYFLAGGRLVSYKKIDIAVRACTALNLPLKVFGSGPDLEDLKRLAGPTVEFLGRVSDHRRAELFADALAYLHPQEEDFGITAIESMASGRPVIAYRKGGATETVLHGQTGLLLDDQDPKTWENTLKNFRSDIFSPTFIKNHAEHFSAKAFRERLEQIIVTSRDSSSAS